MSSVIATASEIRHATRVARTATVRGKLGAKGVWKIDLGIGGLGEERREDLAVRINEALGLDSEGERVGDEFFHGRHVSHGLGFLGSAIFGLCGVDHQLREFGHIDYDTELLDVPMNFSVTPLGRDELEKLETGQPQLSHRQKMAAKMLSKVRSPSARNRFLNISYGISVAVSEEIDRGMRQRHGDRSFVIRGRVEGLDDEAEAKLRVKAIEAGLPESAVHDGGFEMLVRIDRAGTGIGALLIMMRKLGDFFLLLPASASLKADVERLPGD